MKKEIVRREEQWRLAIGLVLAFVMALVVFVCFQTRSLIGYFIGIAISIGVLRAIVKLTNPSSK